MVRMNQRESFVVSSLAQYTQLPIKRKLELIMSMREEYRPIGQLIMGLEISLNPPLDIVRAAESVLDWAGKNKKNGLHKKASHS